MSVITPFVAICIYIPNLNLGLINLQSSINIQQSLGTIGLTVGYVSSVLWSLFVTPIAIEYLGAKTALIISEMSYLIYCAANFYPSK